MLYNFAEKQLSDLIDLLENMDDKQFSASMEDVFQSSIGKHTRHIIEFYQSLLTAYHGGILNYDQRQRNIQLETHKFAAIEEIKTILKDLEQIDENKNLELQTKINEKEYIIPTTVFRELFYLMEHTTHHLALMRMGMANLSEKISIPHDFGYAYSTLNNMK